MNLIAAVDLNWAIGRGGDQLCYIPADLKRFQALTTGHPVILGRKTLATRRRRRVGTPTPSAGVGSEFRRPPRQRRAPHCGAPVTVRPA